MVLIYLWPDYVPSALKYFAMLFLSLTSLSAKSHVQAQCGQILDHCDDRHGAVHYFSNTDENIFMHIYEIVFSSTTATKRRQKVLIVITSGQQTNDPTRN